MIKKIFLFFLCGGLLVSYFPTNLYSCVLCSRSESVRPSMGEEAPHPNLLKSGPNHLQERRYGSAEDFLADRIKKISVQESPSCPAPADNSSLLLERAGGCFSDCFLNPFGSEECDACRTSASDPMPEWTTTEKILWSIGSLLLAGAVIWLSSKLNQGSNCASAACSGYYGTDPYGYYSNPYYGGGSFYGSVMLKTRPIKAVKVK